MCKCPLHSIQLLEHKVHSSYSDLFTGLALIHCLLSFVLAIAADPSNNARGSVD